MTDLVYPSGNHVAYGYDSEDRVARVFDPARQMEFAHDFTYHPSGGLASYTSGGSSVAV